MSERNLSRTENNLIALGHRGLLESLLAGPLPFQVHLQFTDEKQARSVFRHLYNWLFFYPQVKERVSLKLVTDVGIKIILTPRAKPEKRGRKKGGLL